MRIAMSKILMAAKPAFLAIDLVITHDSELLDVDAAGATPVRARAAALIR
jgi:hypothetical protein